MRSYGPPPPGRPSPGRWPYWVPPSPTNRLSPASLPGSGRINIDRESKVHYTHLLMMACLLAGLMQIPSNSYCWPGSHCMSHCMSHCRACFMSHSMSHCRARFMSHSMSHSMSRSLRPVHCAAATISSRTSSFSPAPSAACKPWPYESGKKYLGPIVSETHAGSIQIRKPVETINSGTRKSYHPGHD